MGKFITFRPEAKNYWTRFITIFLKICIILSLGISLYLFGNNLCMLGILLFGNENLQTMDTLGKYSPFEQKIPRRYGYAGP